MIALVILGSVVAIAAIIIVLRRGMDIVPPGAGVGFYVNRGSRPRLRWVGFGAKCIRVTWQDNAGRNRSRLVSWYPAEVPFCLVFHVRGTDRDNKWYRIDLSVTTTVPQDTGGDWAQALRDASWQMVQARVSALTIKGVSQTRENLELRVRDHLRGQGFRGHGGHGGPRVVISNVFPEGR